MSVVVDVNILDPDSLMNARERILRYTASLEQKCIEICRRLAEIGEFRARVDFATAIYDGTKDVTVISEPSENGYRVVANGNSVLFIEYGSGTIGYGHPEPNGYVPGSWSESEHGKGHWQDPNGWYYAHGRRSFGNPPAAAMYNAEQEIRRNIEQIAREVLGNDRY